MINQFKGKYSFLSNFYLTPILHDGITYPSNEHFFQAQKTSDLSLMIKISKCKTPRAAKREGRKLLLRKGWEGFKAHSMLTGLIIKFSNPELKSKLLETGEKKLVEGNTWDDKYWGVCLKTGSGFRQTIKRGSKHNPLLDHDGKKPPQVS